MDVHSSKHQPLLLLMRLRAAVAILCAAHAAAIHQPNPKCPKTCGSVDIPFPFGITKDCALDSSFLIDCNKTTSSSNNSETPYLPKTNTTLLSISLNDGELRVSWPVLSECYANGTVINQTYPGILDFRTPFNVSTSRNKITGVGCDTIGAAAGWDSTGKRYTTGCLSFCDKDDNFTANGSSCPTTGCCEASIPGQGLWRFAYDVATLYNHSYVSEFSPCGHAFVAEKGAYLFESKDLWKFEKKTFPVVLDWAVGNHTCRQAMRNNASSYACKAD